MKKIKLILSLIVLIVIMHACAADTFEGWAEKVNPVLDSVNVDTIIYGTDDLEDWRLQFNAAVDSINNLP